MTFYLEITIVWGRKTTRHTKKFLHPLFFLDQALTFVRPMTGAKQCLTRVFIHFNYPSKSLLHLVLKESLREKVGVYRVENI